MNEIELAAAVKRELGEVTGPILKAMERMETYYSLQIAAKNKAIHCRTLRILPDKDEEVRIEDGEVLMTVNNCFNTNAVNLDFDKGRERVIVYGAGGAEIVGSVIQRVDIRDRKTFIINSADGNNLATGGVIVTLYNSDINI